LAIEVTRRELKGDHEKERAVLCQFLHLYSLTQPSLVPTFAQSSIPHVLEQATSQEVAAVAKLYSELSSSTEVVPQDVKSTLISKLTTSSKDDILEGVPYKRINSLIEGLNAPALLQQSSEPQQTHTASKQSNGKRSESASSVAGGILFMQKSEIDEESAINDSLEAREEVTQAEPEGGAADGIPSSVLKGGATERGEESAKGTVLGQAAELAQGEQDGSATAQVEEPIQTTEIAKNTVDVADDKGPAKVRQISYFRDAGGGDR